MFRGIWGPATVVRGDNERRVGQRFETLATSLLKATPQDRETQLKAIEARNPGMANRLRRFLEQSAETKADTPKDRQAAGWPKADPSKWKEDIKALFPGNAEPLPKGLTGHPRHSIAFEPEPVPVMGTAPPPPGKVVAYAGGETPLATEAAPTVVGASSWKGLPISAVLGAYSGIMDD